MEKIYIKISLEGEKSSFIETPEEAKKVIDSMVDNASYCGEQESYTFTTIEITEEEFKNLPEFKGF